MAKKQWNELSAGQQTAVVVAGAVQFGLTGAALADLIRRSPTQIKGSKPLWTAVAFINFIGPLAYFIYGRKKA